jgi:hypothetical protein
VSCQAGGRPNFKFWFWVLLSTALFVCWRACRSPCLNNLLFWIYTFVETCRRPMRRVLRCASESDTISIAFHFTVQSNISILVITFYISHDMHESGPASKWVILPRRKKRLGLALRNGQESMIRINYCAPISSERNYWGPELSFS